MCELVSGWINAKTLAVECRDLTSHSGTQKLMGWNSDEIANWREWEWTEMGLVVRVPPDDAHEAAWYASEIESRFKSRAVALSWCISRVNDTGGGLYLSSVTSLGGVTLPQSVGGGLYLASVTSLGGVTLPQSVGGGLYLASVTSLAGVTLPQSVGGNLCLDSVTSLDGVTLPQSVGGNLYLDSVTSLAGVTLPQSVGGMVYVFGELRTFEQVRELAKVVKP